METLILVAHVLVAFAIIGLILLQQGKGAEAGASFGGGASQTLFGSQGSGNFFSRMTAILATVFFISSFAMAILAKNRAVVNEGIPMVQPAAESEIPVVDDALLGEGASSDIPEVSVPTSEVPSAPSESGTEIPVDKNAKKDQN